MRRIDKPHLCAMLFLILFYGVDHGWGKLEIKVVEMHHIRFKIFQHTEHLSFRFPRINDFKRVQKLFELSRVKIHTCGIAFRMVSHNPPLMLHSEIFYLMFLSLQFLTQLKNIGFRTTVWIKKLIYHQNLHLQISLLSGNISVHDLLARPVLQLFLGCLAQTVINHTIHIAGAALV